MITEPEYNECGTVRPRTLGYQRCWLPNGHEGDCKSQDGQRWDATPQREETAAWIAEHPFKQQVCGAERGYCECALATGHDCRHRCRDCGDLYDGNEQVSGRVL